MPAQEDGAGGGPYLSYVGTVQPIVWYAEGGCGPADVAFSVSRNVAPYLFRVGTLDVERGGVWVAPATFQSGLGDVFTNVVPSWW